MKYIIIFSWQGKDSERVAKISGLLSMSLCLPVEAQVMLDEERLVVETTSLESIGLTGTGLAVLLRIVSNMLEEAGILNHEARINGRTLVESLLYEIEINQKRRSAIHEAIRMIAATKNSIKSPRLAQIRLYLESYM